MKVRYALLFFLIASLVIAPAFAAPSGNYNPEGNETKINLVIERSVQYALVNPITANFNEISSSNVNLQTDYGIGISSYSWDQSQQNGNGIAAMKFILEQGRTVYFTVNYGNGYSIPGSLRWDVSQNYVLLWVTTRTLTLNGRTTTTERVDLVNPLSNVFLVTDSCCNKGISVCSDHTDDQCRQGDREYFYVSTYAYDTSNRNLGLTIINYGTIEQLMSKLQWESDFVFYPDNEFASNAIYSMSSYSDGGDYSVIVISETPATITTENTIYSIATTGNYTPLINEYSKTDEYVQMELWYQMVKSITSFLTWFFTVMLSSFAIIIAYAPTIITIYEILAAMLSFYWCKGNIFKAFATWWKYQIAIIDFALHIPTLVMKNWQFLAVGAAVTILFGIGKAIVDGFDIWMKLNGH